MATVTSRWGSLSASGPAGLAASVPAGTGGAHKGSGPSVVAFCQRGLRGELEPGIEVATVVAGDEVKARAATG